jgi:hypothetical protein
MELFLNLCWLSLLLPAFLLWWQRALSPARNRHTKHSSVPPLVFLCVLGCALVLLFPVISASDDLHAMRTEMEESSPCKRSVCHAAGEKSTIGHNRCQNLSAVAALFVAPALADTRQDFARVSLSLPAAPPILRADRAPPASRLG